MLFRLNDIESLYDRYSKKLYFTALRITASPMDAEEAMQDAFIKYHRLTDKRSIGNLEAWLTKVCIRNSIDTIRKRKSEEMFIEELSADEERGVVNMSEEEPEEAEYSVEKIRKAIAALPDGYRTILSLHLFEGYDYQEIALITGLKEGSVRSQCSRGKEKLMNIFKQRI